jgi:endonuclease III related protein
MRIKSLYRQLRDEYGPQGWWPLAGRSGRPGFDAHGYRVRGPRAPLTPVDRFEICVGAVLTQNTAWMNVEMSLMRLRAAGVRTPRDVLELPGLPRLIRSSGYFNQKARKLRLMSQFFRRPGALSGRTPPRRADLLSLWGIGPETADSILLYAFQVPTFVVDAYTRRLLERVGILESGETYGEVQAIFQGSLRRSEPVFNEYHALIVAHAKRRCRTRPLCVGCPVRPCAWGDSSGTLEPVTHLDHPPES